MPNSLHLDGLHRALVSEKSEMRDRTKHNHELLEKMKAYQAGNGPAPSAEEFEEWRVGTEHAIAERKLESGFVDLA